VSNTERVVPNARGYYFRKSLMLGRAYGFSEARVSAVRGCLPICPNRQCECRLILPRRQLVTLGGIPGRNVEVERLQRLLSGVADLVRLAPLDQDERPFP
jgi:hypothetical protein